MSCKRIRLVVKDSADESSYVPVLEAAGYVLQIREPDWFEHRLFKDRIPILICMCSVHGMADTWITEHNMKLRQEGADEKQNKALEAWENFVDNAWSNATEEETVMLPVKSMKFVANSQMDERR